MTESGTTKSADTLTSQQTITGPNSGTANEQSADSSSGTHALYEAGSYAGGSYALSSYLLNDTSTQSNTSSETLTRSGSDTAVKVVTSCWFSSFRLRRDTAPSIRQPAWEMAECCTRSGWRTGAPGRK